MWRNKNLCISRWECKMTLELEKTFWKFFTKLKSPHDPIISFLHIYPKELQDLNICTQMFVAALFTIVKRWQQTKCPSADEWTNVLWYNHNLKHKRRLHTWTSPGGPYQNQIDYILCSQRWRSPIQSAKLTRRWLWLRSWTPYCKIETEIEDSRENH